MSSGVPELGSKISLISKADIRYEGRLFTVDPQECTIALASGKLTMVPYYLSLSIYYSNSLLITPNNHSFLLKTSVYSVFVSVAKMPE